MQELTSILDGVRNRISVACERAHRNASDVEIVAVTKTHGAEVVREAWEAGLKIVGENKVQEAMWKQPLSVSGPEWHLIGHLQRNKVRHEVIPFLERTLDRNLVRHLATICERLAAEK